MPLLEGIPVSPLPLPPQLSLLSPETEVWSIHQTGEIFLDYESYANRFLFYSQPIFTPIHPNQQHHTNFFNALKVEASHADHLITTQFPNQLKPRILASILTPQAQSQRSIDSLTNFIYRLHHNRFHINEKVIVDLSFNNQQPSTTIYYARIVKAFPPKPLRDFLSKINPSSPITTTLFHLQAVEHLLLALDNCLAIDNPTSYLYTIQLIDDPQSDLQTSDQVDFGGSYMEVDSRKLSRHPNTFSKSLLKKYIQSSLQSQLVPPPSSTLITSITKHQRWRIREELIDMYNLSHLQPPLPFIPPSSVPSKLRRKRTRQSIETAEPSSFIPSKLKGHKRKNTNETSNQAYQDQCQNQGPIYKPPSFQDYLHPPRLDIVDQDTTCTNAFQGGSDPLHKKKKKNTLSNLKNGTHLGQVAEKKLAAENEIIMTYPHHTTPGSEGWVDESQPPQPVDKTTTMSASKKTIKYPIEDLNLDPLTILDGRLLRRTTSISAGSSHLPTLPTKPIPLRPPDSTSLSAEIFEEKLMLWSFLNIFGFELCTLAEMTSQNLDSIIARLLPLLPPLENNTIGSSSRVYSNSEIVDTVGGSMSEETSYWLRKAIKISNLWRKSEEQKKLKVKNAKGKKGKRMRKRGQAEGDRVIRLVEVLAQSSSGNNSGHGNGLEILAKLAKGLFAVDASSAYSSSKTTGTDNNMVHDQEEEDNVDELDLKEDDSSSYQEEEEEGGSTKDENFAERSMRSTSKSFGKSLLSRHSDERYMRATLKVRFSRVPEPYKWEILRFLCDWVIQGDYVRGVIENADEKLTGLRKERADVNKERRRLVEETSSKLEAATMTTTTTKTIHQVFEHQTSSLPHTPCSSSMAPVPTASGLGVTHHNHHSKQQPSNSNSSETMMTNDSYHKIDPIDGSSPSNTTTTADNDTLWPSQVRVQSLLNSAKLNTRPTIPPSPHENHNAMITPHKQQNYNQESCTEVFTLNLKELELNEKFRQYSNIIKLKPLGYDRFFCRYFWFDGIGDLTFSMARGFVFVCGPRGEEWERCREVFSGLEERRIREEGGPSVTVEGATGEDGSDYVLGCGEWGVYETEEQIESLINWLNPKGIRESQLKQNLKDWKEYIFLGIRSRTGTMTSRMSFVDDCGVKKKQKKEEQADDEGVVKVKMEIDQDAEEGEEEEEEDDESLIMMDDGDDGDADDDDEEEMLEGNEEDGGEKESTLDGEG